MGYLSGYIKNRKNYDRYKRKRDKKVKSGLVDGIVLGFSDHYARTTLGHLCIDCAEKKTINTCSMRYVDMAEDGTLYCTHWHQAGMRKLIF